MEKKYGPLPDMFTNPKYGGGKDYVARWEKISEEAEKKFRTTNHDVKQIIFPGDSRVIVILKDGSKPKWYDMDNAAPEERPAFEKIYGKLPEIVPPATNYSSKYKTNYLKTDLDTTSPKRSAAEKIQIKIVELLESYISDERNANRAIPENLGIHDSILNQLVYEYNLLQLKRKRVDDSVSDNLIEKNNIDLNLSMLREKIKNQLSNIKNGHTISISQNENIDKPKSVRRGEKYNDITYKDDVSVENGMINWQIKEDTQSGPLLLINAKIIGKDQNLVHLKQQEIFETEFVGNGDILNKYGSQGKNGLINFITKASKEDDNSYILQRKTKYSFPKIKEFQEQAAILNILYIGIENPLKISVDKNANEDIAIKMDSMYGSIRYSHGIYYVRPFAPPGNLEIRVYEKEPNGLPKLVNSRFFRMEYLPDYTSLKKFDSL